MADRRTSRILLILVPAVAFVVLLGVATFGRGGALTPGDAVPGFTAKVLGGGELALNELRGRPVVMNFWASWCGPCKDEAPFLRSAHERYGDRVIFLGVNIRDAESDALAFVDRYGLDYIHVRDEDLSIYSDYGLTGQPETFFVDQDGVLVEHVPGPLDEAGLLELLDVLVRRSV